MLGGSARDVVTKCIAMAIAEASLAARARGGIAGWTYGGCWVSGDGCLTGVLYIYYILIIYYYFIYFLISILPLFITVQTVAIYQAASLCIVAK